MKALILKNVLPAATVALAISGAFFTASMQTAPTKSTAALKWGFTADSNGDCTANEYQCSDIQKPRLCRVNDLTGAVVYAQDNQNNCIEPLFRIENGQ